MNQRLKELEHKHQYFWQLMGREVPLCCSPRGLLPRSGRSAGERGSLSLNTRTQVERNSQHQSPGALGRAQSPRSPQHEFLSSQGFTNWTEAAPPALCPPAPCSEHPRMKEHQVLSVKSPTEDPLRSQGRGQEDKEGLTDGVSPDSSPRTSLLMLFFPHWSPEPSSLVPSPRTSVDRRDDHRQWHGGSHLPASEGCQVVTFQMILLL